MLLLALTLAEHNDHIYCPALHCLITHNQFADPENKCHVCDRYEKVISSYIIREQFHIKEIGNVSLVTRGTGETFFFFPSAVLDRMQSIICLHSSN